MGKKKTEDLSWDLPAGAIEKEPKQASGWERHPKESRGAPLPSAAAQDVGAAAAAAAGAAARRAGAEALRSHGKATLPLEPGAPRST